MSDPGSLIIDHLINNSPSIAILLVGFVVLWNRLNSVQLKVARIEGIIRAVFHIHEED